MFTKNKVLVLFLLSLLLLSCGKENAPYFSRLNVGFEGSDCLSDVRGTLDRFFSGVATESEVSEVWDCVDLALDTFVRESQGGHPDRYRATELRTFLEKYFLGGSDPDALKVSDELLKELMEIKRVFLGGGTDHITRREMDITRRLFREFKSASVSLVPHMKFLVQVEGSNGIEAQVDPTDVENDDVEKAILAFDRVITQVFSLLDKNRQSYSFFNLRNLLKELDELLSNQNTFVRTGLSLIPVLGELKSLVLNSSNEIIDGEEWGDLGGVLSQMLQVALKAKYFFSTENLNNEKGLQQVQGFLDLAVRIVDQGFVRRDHEKFNGAQILRLLEHLVDAELMPFGLDKEESRQLWAVVVSKILNPDGDYEGADLDAPRWDYFKAEIQSWMDVQRAIIQNELNPDIPAHLEMLYVLDSPWPLSTDDLGRLIMDQTLEGPVNLEAATQLNLARFLFGLIYKAYGDNQAPIDPRQVHSGLPREVVKEVFDDIHPFLAGLGLIDKENTQFHTKVFREAGLFMPRSNGDELLDFIEVVEYLHFVLAGIEAGENLVRQLEVHCPLDESLSLEAVCFREHYPSVFLENMSHLVDFHAWAAELEEEDWEMAIFSLEVAIRDEGASNEPIARADIYQMGILFQYIETVLYKFDSDGSGSLDITEGLISFELFKPTIAQLLGLDPEWDEDEIRVIFTYMLRYGGPPDFSDPIALLRFLNWRWTEKKWQVDAHRGTFLQILSSLARL